jgi:hydrogenase expression/formation protein HypD
MKHLDEYRDASIVRALVHEIRTVATRRWVLMEVCGGQTHTIVRYGIDELLTEAIEIVHGPGCPVCVTPIEVIDKAIELARRPGVIVCSFGDMLRVPGTSTDLTAARAGGGDVRVVYGPLDAVDLARREPERQVVFLAVGFETTAPANALAVRQARRLGLENFSLLVSHVLVPPAVRSILESPSCRVQGLLAAGHVCTIMGYTEYEPIAERHHVPIVVTGFEPVDILQGALSCVRQLERGTAFVENRYARSVSRAGNGTAQDLLVEVFEVGPRRWRGLGEIEASGLHLRDSYREFDAEIRFELDTPPSEGPETCLAGLVLQGQLKPIDCPAFGRTCTPDTPLGAPMVSSEGACAAYVRYRRPAAAIGGSHGGAATPRFETAPTGVAR